MFTPGVFLPDATGFFGRQAGLARFLPPRAPGDLGQPQPQRAARYQYGPAGFSGPTPRPGWGCDQAGPGARGAAAGTFCARAVWGGTVGAVLGRRAIKGPSTRGERGVMAGIVVFAWQPPQTPYVGIPVARTPDLCALTGYALLPRIFHFTGTSTRLSG